MATPNQTAPSPQSRNQGDGKSKTENKETKPKDLIVTLKAGALSTDVGPQVLASLAKAETDEQRAHAILGEISSKRKDVLTSLTMAIVKAATADDTINLTAIFKESKKENNLLYKQIRLAIGLDEIVLVGKGDKAIKKQSTAKSVAKYFPSPDDNKDSEEYKRKNTFRSNFSHMLKKCIQAASGLKETDIKAKVDKDSGTLLISGPLVEKTFGRSEVLLDEKQGEGENKLKIRPSFTALANIGAQSAGKIIQQRAQTGNNPVAVDAETAVVSQCAELTKTLNKIGKLTDKTRKALEGLASAITTKLA